MSIRLRALIARLHGQNIRPTGEELADVLWLALRMGEREAAQTAREPADGKRRHPPHPSTHRVDRHRPHDLKPVQPP